MVRLAQNAWRIVRRSTVEDDLGIAHTFLRVARFEMMREKRTAFWVLVSGVDGPAGNRGRSHVPFFRWLPVGNYRLRPEKQVESAAGRVSGRSDTVAVKT
jgi:hypothetical protein